jgi:hypothetical protein
MDKTAPRLNIEHYSRLLAKEIDDSRRQNAALPAR